MHRIIIKKVETLSPVPKELTRTPEYLMKNVLLQSVHSAKFTQFVQSTVHVVVHPQNSVYEADSVYTGLNH
jgi:hypothetical protein